MGMNKNDKMGMNKKHNKNIEKYTLLKITDVKNGLGMKKIDTSTKRI